MNQDEMRKAINKADAKWIAQNQEEYATYWRNYLARANATEIAMKFLFMGLIVASTAISVIIIVRWIVFGG